MKKLVEIIPSLSLRGGAEVFFYNLCCELKKMGYQLHVIILYDQIHPSFNLNAFDNVYFCHKKNKYDFKSVKLFKKIINTIKPDIIHTHLSCILPYFLAFGLSKQKWTIFHTLHSIPKKESNLLARSLIKILFSKKNILVGISDNITFDSKRIYKKANIKTIYNGFYLPNLDNLCQCCDKTFDFICVARFSEVKNHKLLFDAFELFYELGHTDKKLVCVGGGELMDYYIKYVSSLKCNNNVSFVGYQDNVENYLMKSKFFILTSFYEGNPISILEAMAVGLPVIAPNVGGIPNVVKNGENGFLFEKNNLNELVDKMEAILTIDYKKIKFTNVTKSNLFSIEKCAQEYSKLFDK